MYSVSNSYHYGNINMHNITIAKERGKQITLNGYVFSALHIYDIFGQSDGNLLTEMLI